MKIDPVKYYYKDLETGVEMEFIKSDMWGYAVSFPHHHYGYLDDFDMGSIPWPELTEEEQKVVENNYQKLYEMMEKEND